MSKNSEKKLCEYIHILEELINAMIENTEIKNNEVNKRIDKLKNILAKRGITPEELESVLSLNEAYDNNLEPLNNDLLNEILPSDFNNINMSQFQTFKDNIKNMINQNHVELQKIGINLNDNHKK